MNEGTTTSKYPFSSVSCDASVLIEMLLSGPTSPLATGIVAGHVEPCTTELAITETHYILCRKLGAAAAGAKINALLASNACDVACISSLRPVASSIKCTRAVSLADCFTIALASIRGIPALFATRESEIKRELEKSPFPSPLYFLDELWGA